MDTIILEIKNLYKKYSDIPVIDNLSMTIRAGREQPYQGLLVREKQAFSI